MKLDKVNSMATLMNLNIRTWQVNKKSDESRGSVASAKRCVIDAVGVQKKLLGGKNELYSNIVTIKNAARSYFYASTLEWQRPLRVCPNTELEEVLHNLQGYDNQFNSAVSEFVIAYNLIIQQAKYNLGDLFNPADYPTESTLKEQFGMSVKITPIPKFSDDFRMNGLSKDIQDEIVRKNMQDLKESYQLMIAELMLDITKPLTTIIKKEKITHAQVENLQNIIGRLEAFNIAEDPAIKELQEIVKSLPQEPVAEKEQSFISTAQAALERIDSLMDI